MPLPYCSEPMSAVAEPFISCSTLSRAAALEQEVIMPFMLKTKNIGIITPRTPHVLKKRKQHAGSKRGDERGDYE